MRKAHSVQVRVYRDHRLEILDDGGTGWEVLIHAPGSVEKHTLRNRMPGGLNVLVEEAQKHVDRRVDGGSRERL